ncbi:MAG TPA: hypothetical protein VLJ17_16615 [Xanthobacteraceae bacterium]|nr:hypothetical protein [Xanthobacteraceae bacterium]
MLEPGSLKCLPHQTHGWQLTQALYSSLAISEDPRPFLEFSHNIATLLLPDKLKGATAELTLMPNLGPPAERWLADFQAR